MTFTLEQFLLLTGGTYWVTEGFSYLEAGQPVHHFSFPNGSAIVSAPGDTREAATRRAMEFILSQVSLPEKAVDR